jgi:magnesium transporter
MIRAFRYVREQNRLEWLEPEQLIGQVNADADPIWVDVSEPGYEEIRQLSYTFSFHSLAIADCLNPLHPPKIEDYDGTLFVIVHGPDQTPGTQRVRSQPLACFIRGQLLVTVHLAPMIWIDEVQEQARRNPRDLFRTGVVHAFYSVFDRMVDQYLKLVDEVDTDVEELEHQVLTDPPPNILQRVHDLRQDVLRLRRLLGSQRDVAAKLARGEFPQIDQQNAYFFRDVYDHLTRVYEELDMQRDSVTGVRDAYLSVLSTRMNEISLQMNNVMKTLTLFATVLLPMTLVAGVFGMNLENMPFSKHPWGLWIVVGMMLLVGAGVLGFFHLAGWVRVRQQAQAAALDQGIAPKTN